MPCYDRRNFLSINRTGLGVELGWANSFGVKIICIFKKGCAPSKSLTAITDKFVEYSDEKSMIEGIEKQLSMLST
jgi:hypothetical protein